MNIAVEPKSSTDLVVIKTLNPAIVFVPGGVDAILQKIETEVRGTKTDISTASGRQAVSSLAYKVARSKTALDEMGKELVSELKVKTGAIDAERRTIRERLDALKDEVRKPLTEWENAEKDRIAAHEKAIFDLEALLDFGGQEPTADELQRRIAILAARPARQWQEFVQRASDVALRVGKRLEDLHAEATKREAERAELERLRRERAEREQRERDERIASEAAERARTAAETKAKKEAADAAEKALAEQRRIEQEKADAVARAERAEAEKKAAAARAEADRIAASEAAERDRKAAIEAERKRVADAKARVDAETAKREADKKHRAKINNEALESLLQTDISRDQAVAIITAIAQGRVPHVKISY